MIILGSGPNRIGQGVEFDYCCVQASFALRDAGFETVMVNCNPETVSTDYDTSDRLYFEPLTFEDVANVLDVEQATGPVHGVIVALGGQTPLKLSGRLPADLILGTVGRIDRPGRGPGALERPVRPPRDPPARRRHGGRRSAEAEAIVGRIGYPALVRPSYVLGGRAMEIVYDDEGLARAMAALAGFGSLGREGGLSAERPVLIDRFLEDAIEVDVDAIRDAHRRRRHRRGDGARRGSRRPLRRQRLRDSAADPGAEVIEVIEGYTRAIADALDVRGPINVQFAVKATQVFVIEANPRASRTVPFVSKATGVALARAAARVMAGATLAELRAEGLLRPPGERGPRERQGGGAALRPFPRRRHPARSRRCARPAR